MRPSGSGQVRSADISLLFTTGNALLIWWKRELRLPWQISWASGSCVEVCMMLITTHLDLDFYQVQGSEAIGLYFSNTMEEKQTGELSETSSAFQPALTFFVLLPPSWLGFLLLSLLEALPSTFLIACALRATFSWPGEIPLCNHRLTRSNTWAGKLTNVQSFVPYHPFSFSLHLWVLLEIHKPCLVLYTMPWPYMHI